MKNAFDKFNGIKPITDADLLPPTFAQTAHNCKLDSGKLVPYVESLAVATLPNAQGLAVTFTDTGDLVGLTNHQLPNGTQVTFTVIAGSPATTGISINTAYYIVNGTANSFQVSTAIGGTPATLTNNGTGVMNTDDTRNNIYPYKLDGLSLTCGVAGQLSDFQAVVNGSFKVTIESTVYTVTSLNFTNCLSFEEIADAIQVGLRAVTHGAELVIWDDVNRKFIIATAQDSVSVLDDGETSDGATDITVTHSTSQGYSHVESGANTGKVTGYGKMTGWGSYPIMNFTYATASATNPTRPANRIEITDTNAGILGWVLSANTTGDDKVVHEYNNSSIGGFVDVDSALTNGWSWTVTATKTDDISASSYFASYLPWKAMDNNLTSYDEWLGALSKFPAWLQIKFARKYVISGFRYYIRATALGAPKTMILQASNDGSEWTDIHSFTGTNATGWSSAETVATVKQSDYYYYRLYIADQYSPKNYPYITELELFHTPVSIAGATYLNGLTGTGDITQPYKIDKWLSWSSKDIDVVKALTDEDAYDRIYWTGDSNHKDKLVVYAGTMPNTPYIREMGMPAPSGVGTPIATDIIPSMKGATCSCSIGGSATSCPLTKFTKTDKGYQYVFRAPEQVIANASEVAITPTIDFPYDATKYAIGASPGTITRTNIGTLYPIKYTVGGSNVDIGNFQLESIEDDSVMNVVPHVTQAASGTGGIGAGSSSIYSYDGAGVLFSVTNPGRTLDLGIPATSVAYTTTVNPFNITVNVNMNWLMGGNSYFYYLMAWVNDMNEVGPLSPISALYKHDSDQVMEFTGIPVDFAVSFANSGDLITLTAHGILNGTPVIFHGAGATTAGLTITTVTYYVINATANTFQVSAVLGGNVFPLTGDGTGTMTSVFYPKKRLYRSATGTETAGFKFLCELPASTATYTDHTRDADLGEVMPERENPPAGLSGIVVHPGGFAIGFVGRSIWMSEIGLMHTWPVKYMQTTNADVVGLSISGNDTYIVTKEYPEIMSGNSPDGMYKAKLATAYPCVSKRSIKRIGNVVMYASIDGLIALQGGSGKNITYNENNPANSIYSPKQWQTLHPEVAVCEVIEGKYHMFIHYAGTSNHIIFDGNNVTTCDEYANGTYVDLSEGKMYMIQDAEIVKFEGGTENKTFIWRSKEFHDMKPWSPSWFRITPNGSDLNVTINLYAEGELVASSTVTSQGAYRFPITRIERKHYYEIVSSQAIDWFAVAENSKELQQ